MRPLLDTNILLDVALARPGLHEASGVALVWAMDHPGSAILAVHSLATLSYLLGRSSTPAKARAFIAELAGAMDIARMDNAEVKRALELPLRDFEDCLVAAAAESAAATHIVTRNTADFRRSPVKAIRPEEFARLVSG